MYPTPPLPCPEAVLLDLDLEENAHGMQVHTAVEAYLVAEWIDDRMRALAYPPRDLFAVRVALSEAVANAIKHGHRNDPHKPVLVRYVVRPREVVLEVRDQGPGFDPAAVPDCRLPENVGRPGGRGLCLMRAFTTGLYFRPPGNQVTLYFRRSAS